MRYSTTAPVKIIVLGAGGTGGYVIPHLYRIAFARQGDVRIIICDGDIVERKNLVRQNAFLVFVRLLLCLNLSLKYFHIFRNLYIRF